MFRPLRRATKGFALWNPTIFREKLSKAFDLRSVIPRFCARFGGALLRRKAKCLFCLHKRKKQPRKPKLLFWRRRRDSTRLRAGQVAALGVQRSNSLNGLPGFHSLPLPFESHSKIQKKTNPATYWLRDFLAEKEGFEPSMGY